MTGFYGLDIPEFHKIYKDPIKCGKKPIKPQVAWNETFSPSGNQPALIKTEFKGKQTNAIEQSLASCPPSSFSLVNRMLWRINHSSITCVDPDLVY